MSGLRGRARGQSQSSSIRGSSPGRGRIERGRGDTSSEERGGRGSGFRGVRGRGDRGRGDTSSEERGGRGSGFRGGGGGGDFRGGRGGRDFRGGRGGTDFRGSPRGGGRTGSIIFQPGPVPPVDARLLPRDLDQLITSFKGLEAKTDLPLRPGYGTLGNQITLRANFFPVRVPKGPIYDYSVEISPKTDINRIKARLFFLIEQSPILAPFKSLIAHDGSQRLVSARQLPQPLDVPIPFYDDGQTAPRPDGKTYVVSITHVRDLDTSELTKYLEGQTQFRDYDPLPLISALNLVLQQYPTHNGVRFGRNRYFFPPAQAPLGLYLGAWKGFFASVRPTFKQLMVNVNVCFAPFYESGNLADAIMEFNRRSAGGIPKKFSHSIEVTTSHLGFKMKRKIRAIAATPANKTFFDCQEFGGRVTVEQYFNKKYNRKLKHAGDLPVVDISTKNSKQPNYVPAELCQIEPGQPYVGRLAPQETANMIRYACNVPEVNAQAIVYQGLSQLGLSSDNQSETVNGFDVSISSEMAVIPARELPPPRLSYKVGTANVRDGSWNILDVKFHRGGTVSSWWVLIVRDGPSAPINDPKDPELASLIKGFAAKCERSGMKVAAPPAIIAARLQPPNQDPIRSGSIDAIRQAIKKQLTVSKKPSFILVILANVDNYIYPGIKRIGDVELGIHTVCMQHSKAFRDPRKQDQYFSNVALKLNTKLKGVNHKLDAESMKWLTSKTTMIVGMDVTHPGPTSIRGTPSVAAVVASVDDTFVQFPASIRVQKSKKEMITDMNEMMTERLLAYYSHNKRLPERIYVYRDGVSEGQFATVLHEELPSMIESFKRFNTKAHSPSGAPYRPKLTIIICGKRHHARFYPTDVAHADRNGNTKPGTVVDKGITEVYGFDFYLQAHAGLQGTVRPTHYTVVYDENRLGADEVQQGTHHVSYLYARATKAVSLVPAAYYADLACERGRCYINDFLVADDKTSTAGVSVGGRRAKIDKDEEEDRVFRAAKEMWGEGLHNDLRETMFYI